TLYYLEYNGFEHRRLMRMREGTAEKLIDVNPGGAIDGNENSGILLSQTETCSNTFDVSDLYHWDPETEELSRLTRCARYIGGRWSPDGKLIAAIKNELGRHRIDLLTSDGTFIKTLFEGEQWDAVLGGDWSPDGKFIVVSLYRRGLGSDLYRFELESGSKTRLTRTRESETSPVFSNDGQSLYFSADYGGVSNIHRLVLAGGRIEQITDVLGGANRPRRGAGKTLLYSAMTPKGTEIHRLPRPVSLGDSVTSEQGDTRMTGFESGNRFSTVATRPYSPFYSGRPSWWLPFFEIGDDRTGVGISTSGSDVLDRHRYSLGIGWEFENDLAIWDLSYTYDRWYPTLRLGVNRSNDLYRDDQGDLERIRREDSGKVELIFPWIKQERIFALDIGAVWELRSDVMHSKQLESEPDERDNLLGAALVWDNTKHYSYSISSQDGRRITAVVEDGGLLGSDFDGTVYRFDWREYFSLWKNHVWATRLAVGRSEGQTTPFELGGFFGSGYDGISALLYGGLSASPFNIREFALRGYSDGRKSLSGSSMNLFSLEYRFPLKLIERTWTVPPLGIDRLSGSLFAESGAAWDSTTTSEEYHSAAGVEINGRFSIGYWLPLGFRLGYGHGFDQGGEDRLYLSVGSSF
ncbi:MAG: BamA/TamA family outer membrane protein, partial [Thermodesulfobacteriota bacterium]